MKSGYTSRQKTEGRTQKIPYWAVAFQVPSSTAEPSAVALV
jgi:hypothetical protein